MIEKTQPSENLLNLLKVEDVARMLNVKPVTIYSWYERGRIKGFKISRLVRFRQEEVKKFLEGLEAEAERKRD